MRRSRYWFCILLLSAMPASAEVSQSEPGAESFTTEASGAVESTGEGVADPDLSTAEVELPAAEAESLLPLFDDVTGSGASGGGSSEVSAYEDEMFATEVETALWLLDALTNSGTSESFCALPEPNLSDQSFCELQGDATPIPANPNLRPTTPDRVVGNALPVVRRFVADRPADRPRFNQNIVPQLVAILSRNNDPIRIQVTEILGILGADLTNANRNTVRAALTDLRRGTTNADLTRAIDDALSRVPAGE